MHKNNYENVHRFALRGVTFREREIERKRERERGEGERERKREIEHISIDTSL